MKIAPKFGDSNFSNAGLRSLCCIEDAVELQMTVKDLNESFEMCKKFIYRVGDLSDVVLHLPFGKHTFEVFLMSEKLKNELEQFIKNVVEFSNTNNIKIGVLFHSEVDVEYIKSADGINYVNKIVDMVEGSLVYILIENAILNLNTITSHCIPAYDFIELVESDHVKFCFDICHHLASENVFSDDIIIPNHVLSRIYSIHFSYTVDNDGFYDKRRTHSRRHPDVGTVLEDFRWMRNKGINLDDTLLVIEITEDDYNLRPDMCDEIELVREAMYIDNYNRIKSLA